ncbi:MAG: tryptophan--tRNA ligase [Desulfurococcales archaeon]|nr:tryptophan--tRNA ligase [Desulfurococcales archaeon]
MVAVRIDPWSSESIKEYGKLFEFFGIKPFKDVLPQLNRIAKPYRLMRRGIIFGHRDFDKAVEALMKGKKVAILTGLMPSGKMHFGHKMLIDQLVYYQKELHADVIVAIADVEAYAVRKKSRSELIKTAIYEYVANYIALGLDPEKTKIYFQSNYDVNYYRLIQLFSRKVTMAELRAIYGEDLGPGKIVSVLTQAADILHPYLPEFGGYDVVVVPVGADQDPHLRLARDIADRFSNELPLKRPASTYHRFMSGLTGTGKMSSSTPDSFIALTDPPDVAVRKLMNAFTGGRPTAAEQRRLGGEPEKCPVYELNAYHLIEDDSELAELYRRCKSGEILCGKCKKETAARLKEFLINHQEKLESAKEIVKDVVEPPPF